MTDHPSIERFAYDGFSTPSAQDWLVYYTANDYRSVDPVWAKLLTEPAPFFWSKSELIDQIKRDRNIPEEKRNTSLRLVRECAEAGHEEGVAISLVSPVGEVACICLSRSTAEPNRSYEELADISLLATSFHERYLRLGDRSDFPRLTQREREVLLWAAEGKADYEIGCILNVSTSTIRFHWTNIFGKLGVNGRLRAVIRGIQLNLVTPQLVDPRPYRD